MVLLAKQDAEKLIENSKIYAEAESKKLLEKAIEKASLESQEQLKTNEAAARNLKLKAEKSMDKAVSSVVNAVLEDT
jgi:vacuolar-type H+-ATPase subunit H